MSSTRFADVAADDGLVRLLEARNNPITLRHDRKRKHERDNSVEGCFPKRSNISSNHWRFPAPNVAAIVPFSKSFEPTLALGLKGIKGLVDAIGPSRSQKQIFQHPCQVQLIFRPDHESTSDMRAPIYVNSRHAVLTGTEETIENTTRLRCVLELQSDFSVPRSRLLQKKVKDLQWEKILQDSYSTAISLSCYNSQQQTKLLKRLFPDCGNLASDAPDIQAHGYVSSTSTSTDDVWRLSIGSGTSTEYSGNYGLNISYKWHDSLNSIPSPQNKQLQTPLSSSPEPSPLANLVIVKYNLLSDRTSWHDSTMRPLVLNGYRCPFECIDAEFETLDQLKLHFDTGISHRHLTFNVEHEDDDLNGQILYNIQVEVRDPLPVIAVNSTPRIEEEPSPMISRATDAASLSTEQSIIAKPVTVSNTLHKDPDYEYRMSTMEIDDAPMVEQSNSASTNEAEADRIVNEEHDKTPFNIRDALGTAKGAHTPSQFDGSLEHVKKETAPLRSPSSSQRRSEFESAKDDVTAANPCNPVLTNREHKASLTRLSKQSKDLKASENGYRDACAITKGANDHTPEPGTHSDSKDKTSSQDVLPQAIRALDRSTMSPHSALPGTNGVDPLMPLTSSVPENALEHKTRSQSHVAQSLQIGILPITAINGPALADIDPMSVFDEANHDVELSVGHKGIDLNRLSIATKKPSLRSAQVIPETPQLKGLSLLPETLHNIDKVSRSPLKHIKGESHDHKTPLPGAVAKITDDHFTVDIQSVEQHFQPLPKLTRHSSKPAIASQAKRSRLTPTQKPTTAIPRYDPPVSPPPRIRHKYIVPGAPPDRSFFRRVSMRPLVEGESLSESDDDVDTSWIARQHRDALAFDNSPDLTTECRTFYQRFDAWFEAEGVTSRHAAFMGSTLSRFAYKNASWLKRTPGMLGAFICEAEKMRKEGVLKASDIGHCTNIIRGAKGDDEERNRASESDEVKEQRERLAWEKVKKGKCPCGKAAANSQLKGCVTCSNPACTWPDYHMKCVGLEKRPSTWSCPECS